MSSATPDWQRALSLFDEALALPPDQREAWLDDTAAREPGVSPLLRKLLGAHRRVETNDVLATLPRQPDSLRGEPAGTCGQLIGPFELIEPIGHGGMGSVWRARYADGRLKRDVAIKLPAATQDPTALATMRERFARERDFLAQLEHPNIARLYDTGVSETGQPFLAMEYVAGEPIDAYCEHHRTPFNDRLKLFLQVLDAVDYAHRQLVLHRDLKPGNVLVDANGNVRLLDFGVAKLLPQFNAAQPEANASKELTEIAGAAMTLAYAAPEQITGAPLSTATDVYALGVMLHRLLTGASPYQPARETRGALEDEVINNAPATASSRHASDATLAALQSTAPSLRRALTGDVDTILTKVLKKRPDERYPTAAALAEDIRRHLARQPISARPDSLWYRTNRLVARHRIAVAASALGVSALIATTGIAVWQAKVATASAARATKEAKRANTAQKFLTGLFASADPEKNKTSTEFAKQVLERGLTTAERELKDDPEAHALVLAQIGEIYRRLGLPEQLLATQRRRVTVLESLSAPDTDTLVDAQLELGRALGDSDLPEDNKAALPRLMATYDLATSKRASAEHIVWALCLIADQLRTEKNFLSARDYASKALDYAQQTLKSPNRFLAAAHDTNAVVASAEHRIVDAREHFSKALAIDATGSGRGPVDQSLTLTLLAAMEFEDGNYVAALRQYLAVIELARTSLGDVNINLSPALRNAVFAAARAGDITMAKRLSEQPLDAEIASGHPMRIAHAHRARGRVAMLEGDFARARSSFDLAEPTFAPNPTLAAQMAQQNAELALRLDNAERAVSELEPILVAQEKRYGTKHVALRDTLLWLGVSYARLGAVDKARDYIERACELFGALRESHPLRLRCDVYRVMLSGDQPITQGLAKLEAIGIAARNNDAIKLPLFSSLTLASTWLERRPDGAIAFQTIPVLD